MGIVSKLNIDGTVFETVDEKLRNSFADKEDPSLVAIKHHNVGEQFFIQNQLYTATSEIDIGDDLVIDTNMVTSNTINFNRIYNSIDYVAVLPQNPDNKLYGINEVTSLDANTTIKKLVGAYFELDSSVNPTIYRPKNTVISTNITIGLDENINITTISNDYTSVNGTITTTSTTSISGSVTVKKFYLGNKTSNIYYGLTSNTSSSGGSSGDTAQNAVCFDGYTYSEACSDIRNGLVSACYDSTNDRLVIL